MDGMARYMNRYRYDAVTFDLRGAGRSTGESTLTNQEELIDVKAMIKHIEEVCTRDIFVVGSSGGAPLAGLRIFC